jgi:hypothetical protein
MAKKKVWTQAARKAFARKMKAARAAKRRRNPRKESTAKRLAKRAGALAWAATKSTAKVGGRAAKAGAKAAAAEVKASICRAKNPRSEFIVDMYASLGGAKMHPIIQVVAADSKLQALKAAKAKLRAEGYTPGKPISIRPQIGVYSMLRGKPRKKNPKRARRRNPIKKIFILAEKGRTKLWFNGAHFSNRIKAVSFQTLESAKKKAHALLRQYPVLRQYHLSLVAP